MVTWEVAWRLRQRGIDIYSDEATYESAELKDLLERWHECRLEMDAIDARIQSVAEGAN